MTEHIFEHRLRVLLRHLKSAGNSPWSENYIEEMIEEFEVKRRTQDWVPTNIPVNGVYWLLDILVKP